MARIRSAKSRPSEVFAVAVDVLTQQRDVLVPGGDQLPRLGDHVVKAARALASAHIGHDAVGAEVVAAVHDAQPGLHVPGAAHGQTLRHHALARRGVEHALAGVPRALIKLGEAPKLVRAEHKVDHAEALFQLLGHVRLLDHAAADRHQQVWVLRLGVDKRADVAQHAHLRVLADGAGVHDDEVGLALAVGEAVAHQLDVAAYLLAVRLVLLAAIGVHQRQRPPPRGLYALAYLKTYLPLPLKLGLGYLDSFVQDEYLDVVDFFVGTHPRGISCGGGAPPRCS